MGIGATEEQEQLSDAERAWLLRHDPIQRIRQVLDDKPIRIDADAVAHAAESGLLELLTIGGTHRDLAVCAEAHGYAASSLPIADLAIARWVLDQAGVEAPDHVLVGVARARGDGSHPVPMAADMAQFAVLREDSVAVVADPALTAMTTLDLTRSWARVTVDENLQWRPLPAGVAERARAALALHRAVDALGAAARLLEMTVEYAGQREQFGVPIGSFQAVKHHCADMALGVEASRATLWAAASALDDGDQGSRTVSAAVAYAKSAASRVASTALQVHGGIGFTWEHDLHLFLRRIRVDEALDGSVADHRAALVPA